LKNLLYIGNKLSAHGFSVTTIETLGSLFEGEGHVVFYSSEKKNKFFRILEMLWDTFRLRNKIDYLLMDTYSTSNFWYAFLVSQLARILNIKYIPILHGGNLPKRLKQSKWASRKIFKYAFKNVSPSRYLLSEFFKAGFSNTIFIPNAIEIKNYDFKQRYHVGPKLLWVRSFAKIYNPLMAVEVFNIIKNKHPDATLCMVGPDKDGSLLQAKKNASNYGLDINFTGKLDKNKWISISATYDIFLNTTHFDNMPVSVIEAMALGLPIVSTNVGGLKYLLQHESNALLVDDNDINSMAEAILSLCENPKEALKIAAKARQEIMNFDWNIVKSSWEKVII
jgi:glycosyltransferase involved in cell wall biosynthesis